MRLIRDLIPMTEWLPRYQRENLRYDVIAGVTVAALVVPKALGYAGIASAPLEALRAVRQSVGFTGEADHRSRSPAFRVRG